jgi:uncharacterized membrane protein
MLLAAATAGWTVWLVLAPLLPAWGAVPAYVLGSLICHQLPDRSFHIDGAQLPVCARCFGLYAGAAVAAIGSWMAPNTLRRALAGAGAGAVLLIAVMPTAATVVAEWLDISRSSNAVRAFAGLPLGGAAALLLAGAAATLHYERCTQRRLVEPSPPPPLT